MRSRPLFLLILFVLAPLDAHAATFTVTNTLGSGAGSLESAIAAANASAGRDTVEFAISGHSFGAINEGGLTITDELLIDGYSQAGAQPNTNDENGPFNGTIGIEIDGSGFGSVPILHVTASNCEIRGLALTGSVGPGIRLAGTGNHNVTGCFVGLNRFGSPAPNIRRGIDVDASGCVIGGRGPEDRNVIAGNGIVQIDIDGDQNRILGNIIGLLADGSTVPGGGLADGVHITGDSNTLGRNVSGARNIVSACDVGVTVEGDLNFLRKNRIGTDVTGTLARGHSQAGVKILSGSDNQIGGANATSGNLVCASGSEGILLDASVSGTVIRFNKVGVGEGGEALGNGSWGVKVNGIATTTLGGTQQTNEIAYNEDGGVCTPPGGLGLLTLSNSIHDNIPGASGSGLGIDHGGDGVAWSVLDPPSIDFNESPVGYVVTGTFTGDPGVTHVLYFYINDACDPSGYGEGQTLLASHIPLQTDGLGNGTYSFSWPWPSPIVGLAGTVSPTGGDVWTSEFSQCVSAPELLVVTHTGSSGVGSLPSAVAAASMFAGADTIRFDIPGPGPHVVMLSDTLRVTDTVFLDGFSQPGASPNTNPMHQSDDASVQIGIDGLVLVEGFGSRIEGLSFVSDVWDYPLVLGGIGGHTVAGCRPGFDPDGGCPYGSGNSGIQAISDGNTIGGLTPADRNVIATLEIAADFTQVKGNFVGIGPDGSTACPADARIWINVGSDNVIGGTTLAERNVISGGALAGVHLYGGFRNFILGNRIGTDMTGNSPVPNYFGVLSEGPQTEWDLGNGVLNGANTIRFNEHSGVRVLDTSSLSRAKILINSIRDNGNGAGPGLGIDLDGAGPAFPLRTPTDAWTDAPVLTAVTSDAVSTRIQGEVIGPVTAQAIVIFYDNAECDSLGHGEGQWFLGWESFFLLSDTTAFDVTIPAPVTLGIVTATVVINNRTSEFSACMAADVGTNAPVPAAAPTQFALHPGAPNPFRSATALSFDVPRNDLPVSLRVYDVRGARVRTLVDGPMPVGRQNVLWDGRDESGRIAAAGVYFARMEAGGIVRTVRVVRAR